MSGLRYFGLSIGCGALSLLAGHVISYFLLPIPHLVFGPLLAAAAFVLANARPESWLVASLGVMLSFAAMAPYSIVGLQEIAAETGVPIRLMDYAKMLSPVAAAFLGGLSGWVFARRPSRS